MVAEKYNPDTGPETDLRTGPGPGPGMTAINFGCGGCGFTRRYTWLAFSFSKFSSLMAYGGGSPESSSRGHIVSSIVALSESICEKVDELKRCEADDGSDELDVEGIVFIMIIIM